MKFKPLITAFAGLLLTAFSVKAQTDSTGMPGDNFSLQGALEMFRQSSSPEDFEKMINSQDKNVNNLDLNGDGETDYIKVIDKSEGNVHAFVLQVAVSETESQDIAVIELEKTGDTTAILQIIGDEDIYGEQVIVEASDEGDEISDDNGNDPVPGNGPAGFFENYRIVINVFYWPSVRFVYRPAYVPWVSPWRWRHYPGWWRPWRPLAWHVFHPRRLHYHRHCAVVRTHRVVVAHRVYAPHRVASVTVRTRTTVVRNNYRVTRVNRRTINVNRGNNMNNQRRGNNGNGNGDGNNGRGKGKGKRG
ncbi:MAG: hypothetical protein IPP31_12150 [Chitinophagaceae bacterium]|nr:hypothetical protein [Chitinophagaceae bacterium]